MPDLAKIFKDLAPLPRWVPWLPKKSETRPGKTDKIPGTKARRLSTSNPEHWFPLEEAGAAGEVGLVFTNGIHLDDYTLLGFDIDNAEESFEFPIATYLERSPSGKGLRAFAWCPTTWLTPYQDCTNTKAKGCDHIEVYFGSAARFLTVTFDAINEVEIAVLTEDEFETILPWLKKKEKTNGAVASTARGSTPLDLSAYRLTEPHRRLLAGQEGIDRSQVLHSLLCLLAQKCNEPEALLATVLGSPALWAYCLDHRGQDEERALKFAQEEVQRACRRQGGDGFEALGKLQKERGVTQPPGDAPEEKKLVFSGPNKARCTGLFKRDHKPREFVVDGVLPVANGIMVAPGSMGKSTLVLREAIHVILGKDIWQRKVLRSGPILIVTAEDSREDLEYRLKEIGGGMGLNRKEQAFVEDNLYIEDISGEMVRFVETDEAGNLRFTDYVQEICDHYRNEHLSIVTLDPLNLVGAGERLVNDAEASMNQVTMKLSKTLNAHVRVVHHTGQTVAREKIRDQYSGRGGSALADNARQVMQISTGEFQDAPLPRAAQVMIDIGAKPLIVDFHKVSYGPEIEEPVIVVRNGWKFWEFAPQERSSDEEQKEEMKRLKFFIAKEIKESRFPTARSLKDACIEIGIAKRRIDRLIEIGISHGEIVEREMPENERRGVRRTYLCVGLV